jgi:hypothetical protein
MIRPWQITSFSLLMLITPFLGVSISESFSLVIPIHRNNNAVSELFSNINSPGNIAICHAEGNCQKNGAFTSLYYGHIDPSKLGGKRVLNQGFCSD